jgi:hypothetical protein
MTTSNVTANDGLNNTSASGIGLIFCIVFLFMSAFMLYTAVGSMALSQSIDVYIFLGATLLTLSLCTYGLWSKFKIANAIIAVYVVSLLSFSFFGKDYIQDYYVAARYNNIDELMINSYAGIVETPVYKSFIIDKNNNDVSKISEYSTNRNKYISINPEKVMQLKLLYTANSNKDIHAKLDTIFKDGLVNTNEYDEFKTFVYQLPLNAKDQSLFAMIQN